ncbi:CYTH domain-containing protein [Leucobacter rhizosphaerae]|uniref:CYTH domain-containing protein n=1 Tax=Leucobacter rhizosphaerae TaxID=2932245 RepID=A0ABY4FUP0_9MICO|nr:CYTH domain-containing protein [Leucobacter rhizosphaerae]UOQ59978.1 CYTH domain-containing protein [Leucobacter rhizosphaerae]
MADTAVESFEIERKYEVDPTTPLPGADAFVRAGFAASAPVVHHLHATYFDTPGADLARNRLALRRRVGGKDAGWHLKQKGADGARELLWPAAESMPEEVIAEVRSRIGDAVTALAPLAELRTERTVVVLRDDSGRELVELADDRVRALDHRTGLHRAWREWEAEVLGEGTGAVLARVEPVLRAAGAVPSPSPAKIARATGQLVVAAERSGGSPEELEALRALDAADQEAARRLVP